MWILLMANIYDGMLKTTSATIYLYIFELETWTILRLSLWWCDSLQRGFSPLLKPCNTWWVKPQVHGSTEVVKRVSFRQGVMNSINF